MRTGNVSASPPSLPALSLLAGGWGSVGGWLWSGWLSMLRSGGQVRPKRFTDFKHPSPQPVGVCRQVYSDLQHSGVSSTRKCSLASQLEVNSQFLNTSLLLTQDQSPQNFPGHRLRHGSSTPTVYKSGRLWQDPDVCLVCSGRSRYSWPR